MPPHDLTLRAAALPLIAGAAVVPMGASAEAVVTEPISYTVPNSTDVKVSMTTYLVKTPVRSAFPLTTDTFIPAPAPRNDEDFFDLDFGDPDPFVVPSAWVEQFGQMNPELGEQGQLDEETE